MKEKENLKEENRRLKENLKEENRRLKEKVEQLEGVQEGKQISKILDWVNKFPDVREKVNNISKNGFRGEKLFEDNKNWNRIKYNVSVYEDKELIDIIKRLREVHLYRLNEYDIVAGRSYGEAKEWYLNEIGILEDEIYYESQEVKNLDQYYIWMRLEEEKVQKFIANFDIRTYLVYMRGSYCVKLTFKQAVILEKDRRLPYMFSTTEW